MRFLRTEDERTYDKVRKRLRGYSKTVTLGWANVTFWTIQEHLEHDSLEQARTHTVALLAALDDALDKSD